MYTIWKMSVFQFVYRLNLIHNKNTMYHHCEVNGAYFVRLLLWSLSCTTTSIYINSFFYMTTLEAKKKHKNFPLLTSLWAINKKHIVISAKLQHFLRRERAMEVNWTLDQTVHFT